MSKDNNIIRNLDSCEIIGNVTCLVTDLNALTTNQMKVVQSHINGIHYKTSPKFEILNENIAQIIVDAISINTSYSTQIIVCKHI